MKGLITQNFERKTISINFQSTGASGTAIEASGEEGTSLEAEPLLRRGVKV